MVIWDVAAIVLAYLATLYLRFNVPAGRHFFAAINSFFGVRDNADVGLALETYYYEYAPRIVLFLSLTLLILYAFMNLYSGRRLIRKRGEPWTLVLANVSALGIFYTYFYLTRNEFHPRSVFATLLALNVIITILMRSLLRALFRRSPPCTTRVLLAGGGPDADLIERYLVATQAEGMPVVARLDTIHPWSPHHTPDTIKALVMEHRTQMIICADKRLTVAEIMQILELGESLGQEVKILSDTLNVLINDAGIETDFFLESPLVHFAASAYDSFLTRFRHSFFRATSAILLVLLSPLMLVIALLIKCTSSGPVFFIQERIGINRQPFRMFKFRTMHNRAEELQAQIEEFNESGEGLFKIRNDPRITRIGTFLRRFSLDELPQLINVIKGDMNLIGPRPLPRRDFANYYEEWHYSRHSGLPGLTCLWQVSGRSDISFHNMCILDDYYLRNQSLVMDLKILVRTIRVVFFAKGAY